MPDEILTLAEVAQMLKVAEAVERSAIFDECGHSLSLEAEDRMATMLRDFMLGR